MKNLHQLLSDAAAQGRLGARFYSIVDKDSDAEPPSETSKAFCWDVYHIENYLLEAKFISLALSDLTMDSVSLGEDHINAVLKQCAESSVSSLISHKITSHVNKKLIACLDFGHDRETTNVASAIAAALARSDKRMRHVLSSELTEEKLRKLEADARREFGQALTKGTWKSLFRGREILRRFVGELRLQFPYETLRNSIVAKMAAENYQPPGMKKVIDEILQD